MGSIYECQSLIETNSSQIAYNDLVHPIFHINITAMRNIVLHVHCMALIPNSLVQITKINQENYVYIWHKGTFTIDNKYKITIYYCLPPWDNKLHIRLIKLKSFMIN